MGYNNFEYFIRDNSNENEKVINNKQIITTYTQKNLNQLNKNIDINFITLHALSKVLQETHPDQMWEEFFIKFSQKMGYQGGNLEEKFNNFTEKEDIFWTQGEQSGKRVMYDSNKSPKENLQGVLGIIENTLKNKNHQEANEIRGTRIANIYNSYAYMIYFENAKEDEQYNENDSFTKNILQKEINFENIVISVQYGIEGDKKVMQQVTEMGEKLQIFDKNPEYFGENLNQNTKSTINEFLKNGIEFRKNGEKIYIFSQFGHFINVFDEKNLGQKLKENRKNFEKFFSVKLAENINLKIDQEKEITSTYIIDTSGINNIIIPKAHVEKLKEYEKLGYSFLVTSLSNDGQAEIQVQKNNFTITSISTFNNQGQKANLWADLLLKKLKQYHANNSKKINNPNEDIPNSLSNNINFVNAIVEHIEKTGTIGFEDILSIGIKNNIPLQNIFSQSEQILKKYIEKGINISNIIVNQEDVLHHYNIQEKDYRELIKNFKNFVISSYMNVIQNFPKDSLKRAEDIANTIISLNIHMTNLNYSDINGVSNTLIWVVQRCIFANPGLIDDDIYKNLIKKYPGIDKKIRETTEGLSENQKILGHNFGQGSDAFTEMTKTKGYETIQRLQLNIDNSWILEHNFFQENPSEKEYISDYKLMIARNIYLYYFYNREISKLQTIKPQELEKQSREHAHRIFLERQKLGSHPIFNGRDMYYIAHYGQDVGKEKGKDDFGTKKAQESLKSQITGKNFHFLDGEEVYDKTIIEGKRQLSQFLKKFIENKGPAQIFLEGHANGDSFSFVHKFESRDKLGINEKGKHIIDISPKELIEILKKRSDFRKNHGIQESDSILFVACKGDYIVNVFTESNEKYPNMDIPMFMTAAETGQNSLYTPGEEIPYLFLRNGIKIQEPNATYKRFFEKGHASPEVGSNPALFIPIEINGKIYPQQIG